jgi:succinoglycan biosynthesis transport protein ExoP
MRLAFWRTGKAKALVDKALVEPAPAIFGPVAIAPCGGDLDLRALGQTLMRKRGLIIAPTMLAAVIAIMAVNLVTPRYKSEARILIDGRENVFLRPNGERNEERAALDAEAVTSQVQLVLSRDLAREIIKKKSSRSAPNSIRCCRGLRR